MLNEPGADDGFSRVCTNFLASQTALLELGEFASVQVANWDKERPAVLSLASRRFPNAPEGQHLKAVELISAAIEDAQSMPQRMEPASEDERRSAAMKTESRFRQLRSELEKLTGDPIAYHIYNRVWRDARMVPAKTDILLSSLLMAAVSDFENLISGFVSEYIRRKPEILRESGAAYSASDVMAFDTIEAFQAHCAHEYGEAAMHGGLEDWNAWFSRKKVNTGSIFSLESGLPEIFQRRHLLVHNGGVVNKFYTTKLAKAKNLPALGVKLKVDHEYLTGAIDALTFAGIALAATLSKKLIRPVEGTHPVDNLISVQMYDLLIQGRYLLTERVGSLGDMCESEDSRLTARVNVWLCQKRLHGIETIRSEVEAWRTSALHPRFELVRLALLDQRDSALTLGKRMIDNDLLRADYWRDWPVLDEVRAYEESLVVSDNLLGEDTDLYVKNPRSSVFHKQSCLRAGLVTAPIDLEELARLSPARCCAAKSRPSSDQSS